jgi:hypothetical protein
MAIERAAEPGRPLLLSRRDLSPSLRPLSPTRIVWKSRAHGDSAAIDAEGPFARLPDHV